MILCTLDEIFPGAWGILSSRKAEVEASMYGSVKKILEEEIQRRFIGVSDLSQQMGVSASAARRRMAKCKGQAIKHGKRVLVTVHGAQRFYRLVDG